MYIELIVGCRKMSKSDSEHFYHEPADVMVEYDQPQICHQHSHSFGNDLSADITKDPPLYSTASAGSGIYESIEFLKDGNSSNFRYYWLLLLSSVVP